MGVSTAHWHWLDRTAHGQRCESGAFAKVVRVMEARTARVALPSSGAQGQRSESRAFAKLVRVMGARTARVALPSSGAQGQRGES